MPIAWTAHASALTTAKEGAVRIMVSGKASLDAGELDADQFVARHVG
jgi:hypothetical protein